MGLRDTLFGRTKQVAPKLDNLFALPTAALTLESERRRGQREEVVEFRCDLFGTPEERVAQSH